VIIGPATWLALGLVDSIRLISERIDVADLTLPRAPSFVRHLPLVGESIYDFWTHASTNLKAALAQVAPQLKPLGSTLLSSAADTGTEALKFLAAIVVGGVLLPPAPSPVAGPNRLAYRLSPNRGDEVVRLAGA